MESAKSHPARSPFQKAGSQPNVYRMIRASGSSTWRSSSLSLSNRFIEHPCSGTKLCSRTGFAWIWEPVDAAQPYDYVYVFLCVLICVGAWSREKDLNRGERASKTLENASLQGAVYGHVGYTRNGDTFMFQPRRNIAGCSRSTMTNTAEPRCTCKRYHHDYVPSLGWIASVSISLYS